MASAREKWAERVEEWRRSGLTAAEYAAGRGLNPRTLAWWSSQLRRGGLTRQTPPVVEVVVAEARALELVLPSGIRVVVPAGFDEETLKRLVATLLEGG